jgi:hypothetical protein
VPGSSAAYVAPRVEGEEAGAELRARPPPLDPWLPSRLPARKGGGGRRAGGGSQSEAREGAAERARQAGGERDADGCGREGDKKNPCGPSSWDGGGI